MPKGISCVWVGREKGLGKHRYLTSWAWEPAGEDVQSEETNPEGEARAKAHGQGFKNGEDVRRMVQHWTDE